jgi:hypothetical protein
MDTLKEFFDDCRDSIDDVKQARVGKKTVAFVGMASTSRHLAPFDDPSIPIWALNESATPRFSFLKRVDRIYQLHPEWDFTRPGNHNYEDYPRWLKEKHPFQIVMQEVYQKYPSSVCYPIKEVVEKFGKEALYFTSSAPYLIAHALLEGYNRIEMYGFEMAADEEYANQKPCAEFWMGVAIGQGCEVYLPPGNPMLGKEMMLYGYEMLPGILPMHVELRKMAIRQQIAEQEKAKAEAEGKKKDIIARIKLLPDNEKLPLIKEVAALDQELSLIVGRYNFCSGVMSEIRNEENSLNGHLAKFEDVRSRKAAILHAVRDTPAEVPPAVINPASGVWNIDEKPVVIPPKKKKHRR